jgi:hypothetical protein
MTESDAGYYWLHFNTDNYSITSCNIGIATDYPDMSGARSQFLRVLIGSMGFLHTSQKYTDSIFNYYFNVQDWAYLDRVMVAMLYWKDIKPGDKKTDVMARLQAQLQ